MARTRAILALAIACGLAGDAAAGALFASEAGRFRVLLPGEPSVETSSRRTLAGRVTQTRWEAASHGAVWAVEVHEVPRAAALLLPDRILLDRARQGFLADRDRREIERSAVEHAGRPAERIRFLRDGDPDRPRVALLVLADARIYIVIGEDSPRARETLALDPFLASFEVWEEEGGSS